MVGCSGIKIGIGGGWLCSLICIFWREKQLKALEMIVLAIFRPVADRSRIGGGTVGAVVSGKLKPWSAV